MSIMPSQTDSNTWTISFSYKKDGELKVVTEEFRGTIKEAIFYEMQLRDIATLVN